MSDNELDAELLALAGDDSSSDEEETKAASPIGSSPVHDDDDDEEAAGRTHPRRGLASKAESRAARGGNKKRRMDDSEEEGEASTSPSSPKSLGSAAMSQSPSVTSGDIEDDAPLYPIEGKFSSEKDRADIMSMTEIQREEILAERAAEAQRKAQDQQLKRLLQARSREDQQSADKRKRKAGQAELEDTQRKSSRQKLKATEPLEAYKRQRELKGAQRARAEDRRREERSPSAQAYSDRDAEGESEVEWDDGKARATSAAREEPQPELRDFQRVCVGRTNFARVCFYPTFQALIKGCFVRVNVGVDRDTGRPNYRLAQIRGFREGKPYIMDGQNNKKVYTDQYALIGNGKQEKEYAFAACSDGKFTDSEFAAYKATLSDENVRLPTLKYMTQKLDDIHALLGHQWTDGEIQSKINLAAAQQAKFANYGRDRILKRRTEALSRNDDTIVAKCDQELAAYDANRNGSGIGSSGAHPSGPKHGGANGNKPAPPNKAILQQERLAALNKANRKANSEEIRKAQIAEKRAVQKAREEAGARAKKAEADAAEAALNRLAVPKRELDDLFGADGSDISRAGTPALASAKGTPRSGTPALGGPKERKGLGGFKKRNLDEDVIAAMDFGIEIDI